MLSTGEKIEDKKLKNQGIFQNKSSRQEERNKNVNVKILIKN